MVPDLELQSALSEQYTRIKDKIEAATTFDEILAVLDFLVIVTPVWCVTDYSSSIKQLATKATNKAKELKIKALNL